MSSPKPEPCTDVPLIALSKSDVRVLTGSVDRSNGVTDGYSSFWSLGV